MLRSIHQQQSNTSKNYIAFHQHSAGCPLFFNIDFPWFFHDQKMKIHDLSAQHIFPSKQYTTYECIPELVVTVPSACSTIVKKIKRFIIWLYKWSRVTFTELLSAVVKIPRHYHHFLWLSMTFAIFHDFPGLENGPPKFHDFPWPGGTLILRQWSLLYASYGCWSMSVNKLVLLVYVYCFFFHHFLYIYFLLCTMYTVCLQFMQINIFINI